MKKILHTLIVGLIFFTACKKDWLEEKRDIKLIVPSTLADLRLLLNNGLVLPVEPRGITEVAAGDFSLTPEYLKTSEIQNGAYKWDKPFAGMATVPEWDEAYKIIEISNVVLDALQKIQPSQSEKTEWDDLKGTALFNRGRAFYNLAVVFALPYTTANLAKPGIHIRTNSDINVVVTRSSIDDTFKQIMNDFYQSLPLVKPMPINKDNPSKAAVYGQLARTLHYMAKYSDALLYADSCLALQNSLLDLNTLKATDTYPFKRNNVEVIFNAILTNWGSFYSPNGKIDNDLYRLYNDNDLRKTLYFVRNNVDATYSFRGTYIGIRSTFGGIATDEVHLIKAECLARSGQTEEALTVLNKLLISRHKTGTYSPYTTTNAAQALRTILTERRKELILRGLRWPDLKRLNVEPDFAITLTRTIDGVTYSLPPNSSKYALPIPDYVIRDYSLQQN